MTVSQTAEYALRAVVWLAREPERSVGTAQIARATHIPAGYLSRVLQILAQAGLVISNPGRSGGFRLARPAERITVFDIVNAIDPIRRIKKCPLANDAHRGELCPLHRRLDAAIAATENAFREATIAILLAESSPAEPLCTRRTHPRKKIRARRDEDCTDA